MYSVIAVLLPSVAAADMDLKRIFGAASGTGEPGAGQRNPAAAAAA